jgi:hypothetical protein
MEDLVAQTDRSCVVSIIPYRLRALKRRQQAAVAARFAIAAPPPAAAPRVFPLEVGTMRAGIRHIASGRMTVIDTGLQTAMALLGARAARRRGLLEDERLEAIVVDRDRRIFAGFWQ